MSLITDETRLHVAPTGHRYRIQFHLDDDPRKPWEDDGAVPILWVSDSRDGLRDDGDRGYNLKNPLLHLSDRAIRANLDEIATLCGYSGKTAFDADCRAYYPGIRIAEARRHLLDECHPEWGGAGQSGLEALARFWTMAGVPAYVGISRGYSQGDWAAVLAVAHPDAVKAWGFKTMREYRKACPDDLKNAVAMWGAWCWGGVLGYVVSRIDPDEWAEWVEDNGEDPSGEDLNSFTECEVDSCWGFYPENDSDYFPLEVNHAYTLGEAIAAADADAVKWAEEDAQRAKLQAEADAAMAEIEAVAMMEARPDLYGEARA